MLEERKGRRNNTKMYSLHFLYVLLKTYHILDTVLYHTSLCFTSYVVSRGQPGQHCPRPKTGKRKTAIKIKLFCTTAITINISHYLYPKSEKNKPLSAVFGRCTAVDCWLHRAQLQLPLLQRVLDVATAGVAFLARVVHNRRSACRTCSIHHEPLVDACLME